MTVYDGATNSVGSGYRIQLDKGSQSGKKHCKITKAFPMYTSSIVKVSSCSKQKLFVINNYFLPNNNIVIFLVHNFFATSFVGVVAKQEDAVPDWHPRE